MENKSVTETDILVVGAGVVGLTAAISFAQQGRKVMLVDSQKNTKKIPIKKNDLWDARIYALTPATVNWLMLNGVWQTINTSRIAGIAGMQLWHADNTEPLNLMAEDADIRELGYIVENQNLLLALRQQMDVLAIEMIDADIEKISYVNDKVLLHLNGNSNVKSTVSANLLLAADGVNSSIRQSLMLPTKHKNFEQTAIVANFLASKPHNNIARQWFLPHETLALLPLPNQYVSMVWSLPNNAAADLLKLNAKELSERVQEASIELGALELVGDVLSFPLQQTTAKQLIGERIVLIGDAAHHIHPMAGQGLNLGLRDVMALVELVKRAHVLQDVGEINFLRQYERSRKTDITRMNVLTSGLDALFAFNQPIRKNMTNWGLRQLNKQAVLKRWMIDQATH